MAEDNLKKDQERLAKLWDAYESQEKELELAMKKIANLDNKLEELDRVNSVLKKAVEDRDKEIRDQDLKIIRLEEDNSKFEPKINELEKSYKGEKERYAKLFTITEELEDDLAKAKKELEVKDKWFERNVGMLENIRESIVKRNVTLNEMDHKVESDEKEAVPSSKTGEELKPEKTEESVTFGTVKLEEAKEKESTTERPKTTTSTESKPFTTLRNDVIFEFTKIENVDTETAEKLYNAGYTSMVELKAANTEDIANIEGISPTLARKVRTSLFEIK